MGAIQLVFSCPDRVCGQLSSKEYLVTDCLTHWATFWFLTLKSDPRDLQDIWSEGLEGPQTSSYLNISWLQIAFLFGPKMKCHICGCSCCCFVFAQVLWDPWIEISSMWYSTQYPSNKFMHPSSQSLSIKWDRFGPLPFHTISGFYIWTSWRKSKK